MRRILIIDFRRNPLYLSSPIIDEPEELAYLLEKAVIRGQLIRYVTHDDCEEFAPGDDYGDFIELFSNDVGFFMMWEIDAKE